MKIKANGITINYEFAGREDAPVVMLSHSLAATLAMWDAQMPALADKYRVLRYDTRGHGATDASGGAYTLDVLADDALGLLEALNIQRCQFVGLSLGGMIGQVLAIRGARQIASVALCATSSRIPPEAQPLWDERIQTAQTKGMAALGQGTLDRWFTAEFQRRAPDEAKRILRMIETTPVAGYVGCAHAIRELNLTERLQAITLSTVVIVGELDPGTPVAASEAIHREIKGSRLVVLDDAMHFCNIEQVQPFNQALVAFLDSKRE
jgi:3-oxoadipate enol-lactonase